MNVIAHDNASNSSSFLQFKRAITIDGHYIVPVLYSNNILRLRKTLIVG